MKQMASHRSIFFLLFTLAITIESIAQVVTIPLQTAHHAIVLQTDKDNRLRMIYSGKPLQNNIEYNGIANAYHLNDNDAGIYNAAYTPAGTWNMSIPAIEVLHADGNPSLELKYISHQSEQTNDGATLTKIVLKDPVYPFTVTLCYKISNDDEVIQQWSKIEHNEKGSVVLQKYASANLYFADKDFYLTTFGGQYAKEMQPAETKLVQGIRSIESTLGTRAMLLQSPNFIVSYGKPAQENEGSVMLGQLSWTGNFKLDFEIDSYQNLRLLAGIHPYNSAFTLQPGKVFATPP
ncbi:MAG: alpha-galactosidase, partial [Bacteroidota bacterium]|nr:alpha-galactosidase [Bacteroidota bacterium]